MLKHAAGFAQDFLQGAIWKVLGLAARGWFLFWIYPRLAEGVLAQYLFLATTGLLAGRVFSLGFDEQLPTVIRGNAAQAGKWLQVISISLLLIIVTEFAGYVSASNYLIVLLLTLCYVTQNVLVGIVRSLRPEVFEVLSNLHVIVFTTVATLPIFVDKNASFLISTAALGLLVSQLVTMGLMRGKFAKADVGDSLTIAAFLAEARKGVDKMFCNFALTLSLRGVVIWPKILFGRSASDGASFAIMLGEALWQLSMVVVNRSYARFCNDTLDLAERVAERRHRSLFLVILFILISFAIFTSTPLLNVVLRADWPSVAQLIVMYGPVCGIILWRYVLWSIGVAARGIIWIFLAWFLVQGLVINWADPENSLILISGSAFLALFAASVYGHRVIANHRDNSRP